MPVAVGSVRRSVEREDLDRVIELEKSGSDSNKATPIPQIIITVVKVSNNRENVRACEQKTFTPPSKRNSG